MAPQALPSNPFLANHSPAGPPKKLTSDLHPPVILIYQFLPQKLNFPPRVAHAKSIMQASKQK